MGAGTSEHRHTVLLIDDHEDLREAFLGLALVHGLIGIAVAGGREALSYLRQGLRPCLILLDLHLPDMDGLAFRREQLADPVLADIPVIVVSGAGATIEDNARGLGLHTFIRKPADPQEMFRLFDVHCGQRPP